MSWYTVVTSRRGRGGGALWDLFYKGTNFIREGPTLMTSSPPTGSTSKYHSGDYVSTLCMGGEIKNSIYSSIFYEFTTHPSSSTRP